MAHSNVSSCVLSIVTSFTNGIDVLRRLRERKGHKKHLKDGKKASSDEELRLSRSLRQGPEDISREYQKSIHAVGDHYAVGDASAQTSLAEILLRLNGGLVAIITTFLHRDKPDTPLDYRSLTDLSEKSRSETVNVLRQLYLRMHSRRVGGPSLDRTPARCTNERRAIWDHPGPEVKQATTVQKRKKRRGPSVARVVIQNSSQPPKLAIVKSGARGKSSRSPSGSSTPKGPNPPALHPTDAPGDQKMKSSRGPGIALAQTPDTFRAQKSAVELPLHQNQTEKLRSFRSTPRLRKPLPLDASPPLPTKILEESLPPLRPLEPRFQLRPPTFHSMASGSTKMGEIPMHKWHDPWNFEAMAARNREAEEQGWPFRESDEVGAEVKKKRGGLFRMLRRKGLK